jgi:cyclophilin family peptidyl-prolyl cis-trans isomerase
MVVITSTVHVPITSDPMARIDDDATSNISHERYRKGIRIGCREKHNNNNSSFFLLKNTEYN